MQGIDCDSAEVRHPSPNELLEIVVSVREDSGHNLMLKVQLLIITSLSCPDFRFSLKQWDYGIWSL
jgi:hypothetical protein